MYSKVKKLLSFILVMVIALTIMPKTTLATDEKSCVNVITGGNYIITSKQSNKAIEVANYGKNDGDLIQQWSYGGGSQQQWKIQNIEDGYFILISKISEKVMQVKDPSVENGSMIEQMSYNGQDNQLWYFEKDNNGYYKIKSKVNNKCLDVMGVSNEDGAKLQLWSDVNGDNQKWKLTKLPDDIISGNQYIIKSKRTNKVIRVQNSSIESGALIEQWEIDSNKNEAWLLEEVEEGYYTITSTESAKVLNVKDGSTDNGTLINQADYLFQNNQLWYFERDNEGYYKIKSKQSNKCLDISNISMENGANIQLWEDVNGDNQKWELICLESNLIDKNNDDISDFYEKTVLIPAAKFLGFELKDSYADEDFDNDGLTNLAEYKLRTNPLEKDTDCDGLSDYDEVKFYLTDPTLYDTDCDGMGDGTEIKNELNPLLLDTDGNGVIDSEEIFEQKLIDNIYRDINIKDNVVYPEITILGKGDYSSKIIISNEKNNEIYKAVSSMVGDPFEIEHSEDLEFEKSNLSFKIDSSILYEHNLNDLKIAYYNKDKNEIEILNTISDSKTNTIRSEVTHFSCYFVIDEKDYNYNIDILNENSKIENGKADVVFAIDATGSMGNSIQNVKNNINKIIDELKENKVDVRLGLVGYKDITVDGLYSTCDYGWFTNVHSFEAAVQSLSVSGGGDWEESSVDALEVSRNKDYRSGVSKYIVLITDAGYKNGIVEDSSYTMEDEINKLIKDKISVSVVTNSVAKEYYTDLYTKTNGIIADISGTFSVVLAPLIEKMAELSGEGAWIRLSNGSIVHLDKDPSEGDYSVDSDKDGIPDLEELIEEVTVTYFDSNTHKIISYKYWTFITNPSISNTDWSNSLIGKVIVIDPGHGGDENGAIREYMKKTYYEKDLNLSIANTLRSHLESRGAKVVMTRTSDIFLDVSERYKIANEIDPDIFVSVHCNSSRLWWSGSTVVYPNNHDIKQSEKLALNINAAVYEWTNLKVNDIYSDRRDLAVLRGTKMPAVITETGYMSSDDIKYIINHTKDIGYAITQGVNQYFSEINY